MTAYEKAASEVHDTVRLINALWPWRNAWGGSDVVNQTLKMLAARLDKACEALVEAAKHE